MSTTTYKEYAVLIGLVRDKAIGIDEGETETVIDQRDGREVVRSKLVFLPRKLVRLVQGRLEKGQHAVLEIPDWLAKKNGLLKPEAGPAAHAEHASGMTGQPKGQAT